MLTFNSCHLLLAHVQFTLIHGPSFPGLYAILLFTSSGFTFPTKHIHNWVSFLPWPSLIFFLVLFLHSFPVVYWTPPYLGGLIFQCHSFSLFILFMGFLRQECWSGLPFPSDHVWSQLSTMAHPSRDPDFEGLETVGYESRPVTKPVCGSVSLCVK